MRVTCYDRKDVMITRSGRNRELVRLIKSVDIPASAAQVCPLCNPYLQTTIPLNSMPATDHDAHRKPAPTLTRDLSPPPTSRTPPPQLNRPTANDVQPATPASSPVTPEPLPVTAAETLPEPEPPKPQEVSLVPPIFPFPPSITVGHHLRPPNSSGNHCD